MAAQAAIHVARNDFSFEAPHESHPTQARTKKFFTPH
jgi:hypothetical protein